VYVCVYVCRYVCMYVCIYVCLCVCMYVCVYVCMYVLCMYVHMYVCMYVFMYSQCRLFRRLASIVNRLWHGRSGVQFPVGAGNLCLLEKVLMVFLDPPSFQFNWYKRTLLQIKRLELEVAAHFYRVPIL